MVIRKSQPRWDARARPSTTARSFLLAGILVVWMVGLVARLYHLQIIQYVELLSRAQRQQQRTIEVTPKRGIIYDRQGHPLAMSLTVDSIFAVPSEIPDPPMVAKLLAPALGLERRDLEGRFKAFRSFCWVQRKVTAEEATRVRGLNLKGIYFQKETKRFYPKGELAAHVLGHVGLDETGLAGLEYGMDSIIKGRPGRVLVASDARRQSFRSTEWEGQPGKDVVLTLDENIQYIAEKTLAGAVRKWRAAGGTVIVQNPNTGEILAMANQPTFDPNEFAKSRPEARINRAIQWVYEPGSTFKLVGVSAALEEKLTHPDEVIYCQQGSIVLAGHTINDHEPFGDLTVRMVVAKSSDVGVIKLALRLGEDRLYRYVRQFGFGSRTEIGLPGEERGLLKPPQFWSGISIGEISMGQEVGITPIQLAAAFSAIANGGILFQPRVVREVFQGKKRNPIPPAAGRRVVSEQTAAEMAEMFAATVREGSGTPARPAGYFAAGKTGTAQKIDASGRYSKTHYIASFAGFAPLHDPAATILVVIDEPVGAIYGREVAAPVFRAIAEQTLGYLNVPHDKPSRWLQVAKSTPAGSLRQIRGDGAGFPPSSPEPHGVATLPVQTVSFTKSSAREVSETVVLADGPLVTVPNFSGLAVRQVARVSQELGLELNVRGSGLAVEQSPAAKSRVTSGSRLWVRFAR
ncbi:MAG: transpeptidase family protein [Acidobacteria bacterium]|nr:transpeptidase family protein [Acidobacteriota bacterium]